MSTPDPSATLRLSADKGNLPAVASEAEQSVKSLGDAAQATGQKTARSAQGADTLARASAGAGQQAMRSAQSVDRLGQSADRAGQRVRGLSGLAERAANGMQRFAGGALAQARNLAVAYGSLSGVQSLIRTADAYSDIVGKLQQATRGEQELATAKAATFRIAQQTYQELDATVTLYSRSAQALAQYNVSQAKVAELTASINRGLLISRASQAESASAILQLSQALGTGRLAGEEFNAVNEAAPRLMQALAESLGVPRSALKKLAEEGKLTLDVLLKAWTGENAKKLEAEAAKVPLTIARAWQQTRNEFTRYIGESDQASNTSAQIAQGVSAIGRELPLIISSATTLAKITAAWFLVYRGIPAVVSGLRYVRDGYIAVSVAQTLGIRTSGLWATANLASMGSVLRMVFTLRAALGLLFAFTAGLQIGDYLRENFLEANIAGIAFVNGLLKGWETIKEGAIVTWETIKYQAATTINDIRAGLAGLVGVYATIGGVIPDFLGGEKVVGQLRSLQSELKPTNEAATTYRAAVTRAQLEGRTNREKIDLEFSDLADLAIAEKSTKAQRDAAAAAGEQDLALGKLGNTSKKTADELRRLLEAQQSFATENARMAAELDGPRAQAEFDYAEGLRQSQEALRKREATVAAVAQREQLLAEQKRRTLDSLTREADLVGEVGRQYERDVYLSSLSNRERRVEEQVLRAADQAREQYNRRLRATAELLPEEEAAIRRTAAASEAAIEFNEAQQQAAEDYRRSWIDVIDSTGAAFGDFATRNIKTFKDFFQELRNIGRRWLSDFIGQLAGNGLRNALGGLLGRMSGRSDWLGSLAGLLGGGRNLTGTQAMTAGWSGAGGGAGALASFGNGLGSLLGMAGGQGGGGGNDIGGLIQVGGQLYKLGGSGSASILTSAAAPWVAGAAGALYGWKQGGDTPGKALGAAAYGAAGYGVMAGIGGAVAGSTVAGSAAAGLAAVPVVGWIALAAIAVDKLSGGKLFGTKYQAKEITQNINVGQSGGNASASIYEEGQKSLFRGKKRRTREVDAGDEARQTAADLYAAINGVAKSASEQLGLASVEIIQGSFQRVTDRKGNLQREFSTILGRVVDESIEAFQQRLSAENILAAVSKVDATASTVAERWRHSAESLLDGAQFLLAATADLQKGAGLLSQGGLSRLTALVEKMREGDETLSQAYARLQQNTQAYGNTAATARQEVLTAGYSSFAKSLLSVRQEEKERIKTLQDQARVLGGLSAREEDLAAVRQSAQIKTDALVKSLESELRDLALNRINDAIEQLGGTADGTSSKIRDFINSLKLSDTLSPDTDRTKRNTADELLRGAAASGNVDSFIQYAQEFLEVSRRLNASSSGYQTDYNNVLSLANQFGLGGGNAQRLEDLYKQRDALKAQQESAARLERSQRIAQGVADLTGVRGGNPLDVLRQTTGMTPEQLAADLGLTVDQLSEYLSKQQTDLNDLASILFDLPKRIGAEIALQLADKLVPANAPPPAPAPNNDRQLAEVNQHLRAISGGMGWEAWRRLQAL